ncbi:hypothetical protein PR202_ga29914 [Eleusine coracana subsp. coracana]|uniref:Uncharacterized protein n=1 Tax=Eleusine coracana subsp. coracana TaxID=191504 RepID=A0AAV5DMJ1_ELECO|nr:hypothetical protein PR202_ga29914 [Eleusine coracana subsp. coracana]
MAVNGDGWRRRGGRRQISPSSLPPKRGNLATSLSVRAIGSNHIPADLRLLWWQLLFFLASTNAVTEVDGARQRHRRREAEVESWQRSARQSVKMKTSSWRQRACADAGKTHAACRARGRPPPQGQPWSDEPPCLGSDPPEAVINALLSPHRLPRSRTARHNGGSYR